MTTPTKAQLVSTISYAIRLLDTGCTRDARTALARAIGHGPPPVWSADPPGKPGRSPDANPPDAA